VQGVLGPGRVIGRGGERSLHAGIDRRKARQHLVANHRARRIPVIVGRIVHERQREPLGQRARLVPTEVQQRSPPPPIVRPHPPQTSSPGAAGQVQEHGLGLVGARVTQREPWRVEVGRHRHQRGAAFRPSARRQPRASAQVQPPVAHRDADLGRERSHESCLRLRLGPQGVIDVSHRQRQPLGALEQREQAEQRDRVCAPRTGHQHGLWGTARRRGHAAAHEPERARNGRMIGRRPPIGRRTWHRRTG